MLKVSIQAPVIKKTISVKFTGELLNDLPKATLLGSSGEHLKNYFLVATENELSLDDIVAGKYTLKVEAGNQVYVKQIIVP